MLLYSKLCEGILGGISTASQNCRDFNKERQHSKQSEKSVTSEDTKKKEKKCRYFENNSNNNKYWLLLIVKGALIVKL